MTEGIKVMALIGTFVVSTVIFGGVTAFASLITGSDDWSLAAWLWSCVLFGVIAMLYVGNTVLTGG